MQYISATHARFAVPYPFKDSVSTEKYQLTCQKCTLQLNPSYELASVMSGLSVSVAKLLGPSDGEIYPSSIHQWLALKFSKSELRSESHWNLLGVNLVKLQPFLGLEDKLLPKRTWKVVRCHEGHVSIKNCFFKYHTAERG